MSTASRESLTFLSPKKLLYIPENGESRVFLDEGKSWLELPLGPNTGALRAAGTLADGTIWAVRKGELLTYRRGCWDVVATFRGIIGGSSFKQQLVLWSKSTVFRVRWEHDEVTPGAELRAPGATPPELAVWHDDTLAVVQSNHLAIHHSKSADAFIVERIPDPEKGRVLQLTIHQGKYDKVPSVVMARESGAPTTRVLGEQSKWSYDTVDPPFTFGPSGEHEVECDKGLRVSLHKRELLWINKPFQSDFWNANPPKAVAVAVHEEGLAAAIYDAGQILVAETTTGRVRQHGFEGEDEELIPAHVLKTWTNLCAWNFEGDAPLLFLDDGRVERLDMTTGETTLVAQLAPPPLRATGSPSLLVRESFGWARQAYLLPYWNEEEQAWVEDDLPGFRPSRRLGHHHMRIETHVNGKDHKAWRVFRRPLKGADWEEVCRIQEPPRFRSNHWFTAIQGQPFLNFTKKLFRLDLNNGETTRVGEYKSYVAAPTRDVIIAKKPLRALDPSTLEVLSIGPSAVPHRTWSWHPKGDMWHFSDWQGLHLFDHTHTRVATVHAQAYSGGINAHVSPDGGTVLTTSGLGHGVTRLCRTIPAGPLPGDNPLLETLREVAHVLRAAALLLPSCRMNDDDDAWSSVLLSAAGRSTSLRSDVLDEAGNVVARSSQHLLHILEEHEQLKTEMASLRRLAAERPSRCRLLAALADVQDLETDSATRIRVLFNKRNNPEYAPQTVSELQYGYGAALVIARDLSISDYCFDDLPELDSTILALDLRLNPLEAYPAALLGAPNLRWLALDMDYIGDAPEPRPEHLWLAQ